LSTSRIIVAQALRASPELRALVDNRIGAASSFNVQSKRPLIAIRAHTDFPGAHRIGRREYIQVWAHDTPGDYETIDNILTICRQVLEAIQPSVALGEFLECRWVETGVDLRDDVMESITRYSRYQLTFSRREVL